MKPWVTTRKFPNGMVRVTWWVGRKKWFVFVVGPNQHAAICTTRGHDWQGRVWYPRLDTLRQLGPDWVAT